MGTGSPKTLAGDIVRIAAVAALFVVLALLLKVPAVRSVLFDLDTFRAVLKGGLVLDPEIARDALAASGPVEGTGEAPDAYETLTDREKQVLKLVAEGHSNKEVADALGISVKTAMSHREHVMEKLDLHSRTELIRFAIKQGIIRVDS